MKRIKNVKKICIIIFSILLMLLFVAIFLNFFCRTIPENKIKEDIYNKVNLTIKKFKSQRTPITNHDNPDIKILKCKDTEKEKILFFSDLNSNSSCVGLGIYEKKLNRYSRKIIGYKTGFYYMDCFTTTENNKKTANISIGGLKTNKKMAYFTISTQDKTVSDKVFKSIIKDDVFLETYTLEYTSSSLFDTYELKFYDIHDNDITSELEIEYQNKNNK